MNHDEIEAIKKVELNILKEFTKVCDNLGIKYYLAFGTMLGAVRHKGFIPWDDDVDVVLLRKDYEKLMAEGQALLPENLFLQNYNTDKEFLLSYSKIRDNNTAFIEQSQCNASINHGIFIDIFPLDYCYEDKIKQNKIFKKIDFKHSLLSPFFSPITDIVCKQSLMQKIITKIKRIVQRALFFFQYGSKRNTNKLLRDIDAIKQSVPISSLVSAYDDNKIEENCLYNQSALYVFEDTQFNGVKEYDKYLKVIYGDYMQLPPEEKRMPQHYTTVIDTKKSYKEYIKKN